MIRSNECVWSADLGVAKDLDLRRIMMRDDGQRNALRRAAGNRWKHNRRAGGAWDCGRWAAEAVVRRPAIGRVPAAMLGEQHVRSHLRLIVHCQQQIAVRAREIRLAA